MKTICRVVVTAVHLQKCEIYLEPCKKGSVPEAMVQTSCTLVEFETSFTHQSYIEKKSGELPDLNGRFSVPTSISLHIHLLPQNMHINIVIGTVSDCLTTSSEKNKLNKSSSLTGAKSSEK